MSKVLVAYFSASGVTAAVAAELAKADNADLFEIRPAVAYSAADLDWRDKQSRSTLEMADPDCRPQLAECELDLSNYDIVFVGFPIWWGREPSVVDSFLECADFSGKRIIPFCTPGGSGMGKTAERIRSIVGENVRVDEGSRLAGTVSEEDLKIWSEGLGL